MCSHIISVMSEGPLIPIVHAGLQSRILVQLEKVAKDEGTDAAVEAD